MGAASLHTPSGDRWTNPSPGCWLSTDLVYGIIEADGFTLFHFGPSGMRKVGAAARSLAEAQALAEAHCWGFEGGKAVAR